MPAFDSAAASSALLERPFQALRCPACGPRRGSLPALATFGPLAAALGRRPQLSPASFNMSAPAPRWAAAASIRQRHAQAGRRGGQPMLPPKQCVRGAASAPPRASFSEQPNLHLPGCFGPHLGLTWSPLGALSMQSLPRGAKPTFGLRFSPQAPVTLPVHLSLQAHDTLRRMRTTSSTATPGFLLLISRERPRISPPASQGGTRPRLLPALPSDGAAPSPPTLPSCRAAQALPPRAPAAPQPFVPRKSCGALTVLRPPSCVYMRGGPPRGASTKPARRPDIPLPVPWGATSAFYFCYVNCPWLLLPPPQPPAAAPGGLAAGAPSPPPSHWRTHPSTDKAAYLHAATLGACGLSPGPPLVWHARPILSLSTCPLGV
jgi:hypothetical protein